MLSAYHLGIEAADLTKLFTMLGFGNMVYFKRIFSRHEAFINDGILSATSEIIKDSMVSEIRATVHKLYGEKLDVETINNWCKQAKMLSKQKQIIEKLPLAASFDMGCQKCAVGKVFDSLSGHGYMVGCETGKVVDMGK